MLVTHDLVKAYPKKVMSGVFNGVPGVGGGGCGWRGVSFWFSPPAALVGDVPFEKKLWYVRSPAWNPGQKQLVCRRLLSIKNTLKETCNNNAIPHFFCNSILWWYLGLKPFSCKTLMPWKFAKVVGNCLWESPILGFSDSLVRHKFVPNSVTLLILMFQN